MKLNIANICTTLIFLNSSKKEADQMLENPTPPLFEAAPHVATKDL